jgi:hypothetical protein
MIDQAMADGTLMGFDSFQLENCLAQFSGAQAPTRPCARFRVFILKRPHAQATCEKLRDMPMLRVHELFTQVPLMRPAIALRILPPSSIGGHRWLQTLTYLFIALVPFCTIPTFADNVSCTSPTGTRECFRSYVRTHRHGDPIHRSRGLLLRDCREDRPRHSGCWPHSARPQRAVQDPFANSINDIPMNALCSDIERAVRETMSSPAERDAIPDRAMAIDGYLW